MTFECGYPLPFSLYDFDCVDPLLVCTQRVSMFDDLFLFLVLQPKTVLGINRVDYMLDYREVTEGEGMASLGIKQVEVNTIAAGLCGLTQGRVQDFHR